MICKDCNEKLDNKNHSGGSATCLVKAECAVCGREYGELADHTYGTEWDSDADRHWHTCEVCNEKTDVADHTDEIKDHKCDVCGKVLSKCEDIDKGHKCDTCGKVLSGHTGGVATCKEQATCTICSQKYGELAEHTYKSEWISDDGKHWHECSVCGERKEESGHSFEWKIDKEATDSEAGSKHEECTVCSFKKAAVTIPATSKPVEPTPDPVEIPEKSGLSRGMVALIIICTILVAALIVFIIVWFVVKKKSFADIKGIFKK